ncbi:DNA replication factor Cdt1 isoform X2 [Nematostella vectensis]|uniref:DNA replication factor Cdt1 isoform X2 n=1 Tax=Nematostella vectensis TaxID=45351 RepID=UPI0020771177|nr:DNA replication factor Cdt1 isoform X2 [Nematostella vectensis]
MDQPTLTEFFSTRKRPIEGVHPAKRRKLIETESVVSETPKSVRGRQQRAKTTTTTTKPKQRTTRTRNAKAKATKAPGNEIHRVFLRSVMQKVVEESSNSVSEVTSVSDEHDVIEATPSLNGVSERKRKTRPENAAVAEKKPGSTIEKDGNSAHDVRDEIAQPKMEGSIKEKANNTKGNRMTKTSGTRKQKEAPGSEAEPSQKESTPMPSDDTIESNQHEITKSPLKHETVKRNSGGLKINPWIAEQANKVLLSRGEAALLLSQQKQANAVKSKGKQWSKGKGVVPGVLSEGKAKEGLERARQLIKNMRSLESKAAEAKASTETEKPERLHEAAKCPTSTKSKEGSKKSPKKAPAHERFHTIAQPTPPLSGTSVAALPLPYKYKVLAEIFNCCDTVVNLLGQRNEACTFEKLTDSVQKMCRKRFERRHLAQIVNLMPSAFHVQQVRNSSKSISYNLTIQFGPAENSSTNRLTVTMSELLSRKKIMQNALLKVTKEHHQTFLQNLEEPISVDSDKIIRWHPQFKLDEVPDLEQGALPEAPVVKTFTSAKDVLDRGRGNIPPRVEKALSSVAKKTEDTPSLKLTFSRTPVDSPPKTPEKASSGALKGVSLDLLNKIRKKEAKKLEEDLTRDPGLDKKMTMRERLPELCRILKTYFTTERKAAIPLEDAVLKLSESYSTSLSSTQVDQHLKLLSTLVPEWLAIVTVRKCPYLKINKKADINSVINKVVTMELK